MNWTKVKTVQAVKRFFFFNNNKNLWIGVGKDQC